LTTIKATGERLVQVDSVGKPRTLIHAVLEGLISARSVISKFLCEKYQSIALSCTVDFQWQGFTTQQAMPGRTAANHMLTPGTSPMSIVAMVPAI